MMKIKIIFLLLMLFLALGSTQSFSVETNSQNVLTYQIFGELLINIMGLELPESAELLSDKEYYEVIVNMLAENGVSDFIDNSPNDAVTRSVMANVIYGISGSTEDLTPDQKIDYLVEKDYMPKSYNDSSITFIEGEVLILKKDSKEWQKVKLGDILEDGDTVKTLETSKTKLQLSPGGKVTLKENASIKLNTVDSNGPEKGGSTELFLSEGEIKASIKRLEEGSTFEVKTPNAACGIRGTVFYMTVDELLNTGLLVGESKVHFLNLLSNLYYDVNQNEGSSADNKGNITKPTFVPFKEQRKWVLGFEGINNSISVTFGEGVGILNNPNLAALLAEAYSQSGNNNTGGNITGVQGEGPASPI